MKAGNLFLIICAALFLSLSNSCRSKKNINQLISNVDHLKLDMFRNTSFSYHGDYMLFSNLPGKRREGYLTISYDASSRRIISVNDDRYEGTIVHDTNTVKLMSQKFLDLDIFAMKVDSCLNVYLHIDNVEKPDYVLINDKTCLNDKLVYEPYKKKWFKVK